MAIQKWGLLQQLEMPADARCLSPSRRFEPARLDERGTNMSPHSKGDHEQKAPVMIPGLFSRVAVLSIMLITFQICQTWVQPLNLDTPRVQSSSLKSNVGSAANQGPKWRRKVGQFGEETRVSETSSIFFVQSSSLLFYANIPAQRRRYAVRWNWLLADRLFAPPFRSHRRRLCYDPERSKRSRFITLFHTATKSCRNFSWESSNP